MPIHQKCPILVKDNQKVTLILIDIHISIKINIDLKFVKIIYHLFLESFVFLFREVFKPIIN